MKKYILTALLLVAISSAFAQTPAAAPDPKKQFTPDYSKNVTIQLKLPLGIFSQYSYTIEHPDFENSDLPGKNITAIKRGNAAIADSIYINYSRILQAQHDAWAADTLKQFNSKKKQ